MGINSDTLVRLFLLIAVVGSTFLIYDAGLLTDNNMSKSITGNYVYNKYTPKRQSPVRYTYRSPVVKYSSKKHYISGYHPIRTRTNTFSYWPIKSDEFRILIINGGEIKRSSVSSMAGLGIDLKIANQLYKNKDNFIKFKLSPGEQRSGCGKGVDNVLSNLAKKLHMQTSTGKDQNVASIDVRGKISDSQTTTTETTTSNTNMLDNSVITTDTIKTRRDDGTTISVTKMTGRYEDGTVYGTMVTVYDDGEKKYSIEWRKEEEGTLTETRYNKDGTVSTKISYGTGENGKNKVDDKYEDERNFLLGNDSKSFPNPENSGSDTYAARHRHKIKGENKMLETYTVVRFCKGCNFDSDRFEKIYTKLIDPYIKELQRELRYQKNIDAKHGGIGGCSISMDSCNSGAVLCYGKLDNSKFNQVGIKDPSPLMGQVRDSVNVIAIGKPSGGGVAPTPIPRSFGR